MKTHFVSGYSVANWHSPDCYSILEMGKFTSEFARFVARRLLLPTVALVVVFVTSLLLPAVLRAEDDIDLQHGLNAYQDSLRSLKSFDVHLLAWEHRLLSAAQTITLT